MGVVDPCLTRSVDAAGRPVLRLGVELLDDYLVFVAMGVVLIVVGVYLVVDDLQASEILVLILGLALIAGGVDIAATGWRSALVVVGDSVTVRAAFRSRRITRSEIAGIEADSGGVRISYTRDGRSRVTTSDAGQGLLNSLGGKLFRRQTRTEPITSWWHADGTQPADTGS